MKALKSRAGWTPATSAWIVKHLGKCPRLLSEGIVLMIEFRILFYPPHEKQK